MIQFNIKLFAGKPPFPEPAFAKDSTLLDKPEHRVADIEPVRFCIPDGVVGYGLDLTKSTEIYPIFVFC